MKKEVSRSKIDESLRGRVKKLIVFGEAAVLIEPGERPLNYPPLGERVKASEHPSTCVFRTFYYF